MELRKAEAERMQQSAARHHRNAVRWYTAMLQEVQGSQTYIDCELTAVMCQMNAAEYSKRARALLGVGGTECAG